MANTTWNPADATSNIQFSGGNLTVTCDIAGATNGQVRATDRQITGKFYWEVKVTVWQDPNLTGPGFSRGPGTLNLSTATMAQTGVCQVIKLGTIYLNGLPSGFSLGVRAANDTISIAVDGTARLAWFRVAPSGNWNGSATANPATGTGGVNIASIGGGGIPYYPFACLYGTGDSATANFGDAAFVGTVPAGFTSGFTKDPTVLLIHADGANGSTTFTDVSPSGHTLGAFGASVSTTSPKFGSGSVVISTSAAQIIQVDANTADWNFGSGQFTIEAWAYFTSAPTGSSIHGVVTQFGGSSNLGFFFGQVQGALNFHYSTTGSDNSIVGAAYTPPLNQWIHLAVDRDASNVTRIYRDGVIHASATVSASLFASTRAMTVGNDNGNARGFPGNLDEIRITKGLARYGGAFTPPTAPFIDLDTNMLTTQAAVEEWASGNPAMQLTQAVIEEWGSVATYSPYTTWSLSDKSATVTITGSDLIATAPGPSGVRAVDRQIAGKFYWEANFPTGSANSLGVGIANVGASFATLYSLADGAFIAYATTGAVWLNGASAGFTLGAFSPGEIVGMALDMTSGLVWVRRGAAGNWNNNAANNPATGVGGINFRSIGDAGAIPLYPAAAFGTGGGQIAANFGAAAFSGAVPSGYTSGFPSGAVIPVNTIATQLAADTWAAPPAPAAQLTNISIEQWAQVATINPQAVVTQIALDEWATVAAAVPPASTGGGPMISIII